MPEYELLVQRYRQQYFDKDGEAMRLPGGGVKARLRVKGEHIADLTERQAETLLACKAIKKVGDADPEPAHATVSGALPLAPTGEKVVDQEAYRKAETDEQRKAALGEKIESGGEKGKPK
jgi:hypothetical protein